MKQTNHVKRFQAVLALYKILIFIGIHCDLHIYDYLDRMDKK